MCKECEEAAEHCPFQSVEKRGAGTEDYIDGALRRAISALTGLPEYWPEDKEETPQ